MITATKEFKFEAAHRLPNHPGACRNVHGHSYVLQVEVVASIINPEGELNVQGMVCDFSQVKKAIENGIGHWDHALILHRRDPLITLFNEADIEDLPHAGLNIVELETIPTAENMAKLASELIGARLPNFIEIASIKVWETSTSFAEWRKS